MIFATKEDICDLRNGIREEMHEFRTEIRDEIRELRNEIREDRRDTHRTLEALKILQEQNAHTIALLISRQAEG